MHCSAAPPALAEARGKSPIDFKRGKTGLTGTRQREAPFALNMFTGSDQTGGFVSFLSALLFKELQCLILKAEQPVAFLYFS